MICNVLNFVTAHAAAHRETAAFVVDCDCFTHAKGCDEGEQRGQEGVDRGLSSEFPVPRFGLQSVRSVVAQWLLLRNIE